MILLFWLDEHLIWFFICVLCEFNSTEKKTKPVCRVGPNFDLCFFVVFVLIICILRPTKQTLASIVLSVLFFKHHSCSQTESSSTFISSQRSLTLQFAQLKRAEEKQRIFVSDYTAKWIFPFACVPFFFHILFSLHHPSCHMTTFIITAWNVYRYNISKSGNSIANFIYVNRITQWE